LTTETPPRVARLGDRFLAVILDTLVVVALYAVIGMYAAVLWGGVTEIGFSLEGTAALVVIGVTLVIAFSYYWLAEAWFGATLGKAMVGIRVRASDGGKCTLKASAIRNLARVIDGFAVYLVGFLVALFSSQRRRIGDYLGKTVVVEGAAPRPLRIGVVLVWLITLTGGIWWAYQTHPGTPETTASLPGVSLPSTGQTGGAPLVDAALNEPRPVAGISLPVRAKTGNLAVTSFTLLEEQDGTERAPVPYRPGEKIYTVSEVRGFSTDDRNRISLRFEIVPVDPGGAAVTEPWTYSASPVLTDPNEPMRLTFNLELPPFAPPGAYRLQMKVLDQLNQDYVEVVPGFSVSDEGMVPAQSLEIRDFQVSRTRNGPAEPDAVFRAGQRVYMTCRLMGMQLLQGRADTNVELQVLDPSGAPLLEKASVVEIDDPIPYHPPTHFVRLNFWVGLPEPASPGSYMITYKAGDRVAGRVVEQTASFRVE
jgi:uncharacterized RDD family membrane protein YckC